MSIPNSYLDYLETWVPYYVGYLPRARLRRFSTSQWVSSLVGYLWRVGRKRSTISIVGWRPNRGGRISRYLDLISVSILYISFFMYSLYPLTYCYLQFWFLNPQTNSSRITSFCTLKLCLLPPLNRICALSSSQILHSKKRMHRDRPYRSSRSLSTHIFLFTPPIVLSQLLMRHLQFFTRLTKFFS